MNKLPEFVWRVLFSLMMLTWVGAIVLWLGWLLAKAFGR